MGGFDLEVAEQRFDAIETSLPEADGIRISVGIASIAVGETVDELIARADEILYARRRTRRGVAS